MIKHDTTEIIAIINDARARGLCIAIFDSHIQ